MTSALGKWFLSKIGGIKPSVTTPVVKDEEVLSQEYNINFKTEFNFTSC